MNVLFDIQGSGRASGSVLLCEWGTGHCCVALLDGESRLIHRLRYWSLPEPAPAADTETVLETLRSWSAHAARTVFCSAFPEALLVPQRWAELSPELTQTIYPHRGTALLDGIAEWQLSTAFALPAGIDRTLRAHFPEAVFVHALTPAISSRNGANNTCLQIHFAPGQIRVLAKRDGFLQLGQIYRYDAPADVVYLLLRISEAVSLTRDTPLLLSGLIDEASALYTELHQFFPDLRFETVPGAVAEDGRPAHFFTSLHNLAQCVS